MKRIQFFSFTIFIILAVSCNNGGKKKLSTDVTADSCQFDEVSINVGVCYRAGIGNLAVTFTEADPWIQHFKATYRSTPGMETSYWVDSCAIGILWDFLEQNKKYDGVWVTFACEEATGSKTSIRLVPSKETSTGDHSSEWAALSGLSIPAGCTVGDIFNTDDSKAKNFRKNFRKEGGAEVKDLSRKVWVDTCVIHILRTIINEYKNSTSTTKLDGVFIYSAAYDTQLQVGRRPPGYNPAMKQSTVVLVPSYRCRDERLPAWSVNKFIFDKYVKATGMGGFNHGELCPNACIPGEN